MMCGVTACLRLGAGRRGKHGVVVVVVVVGSVGAEFVGSFWPTVAARSGSDPPIVHSGFPGAGASLDADAPTCSPVPLVSLVSCVLDGARNVCPRRGSLCCMP
jgi:hypothetical protein